MTHRAPIVIVPYAEAWPSTFAQERDQLARLFPEAGTCIEHIGSTAVPGLAAKPIIDILIGVTTLAQVEVRVDDLARLGYEYMPQHECVLPQRRFFAKPLVRPRRFHLHGVVVGEAFWKEHIAFRDALRSSRALASEYETLKRGLAAQFGNDRESYTDAKSGFITRVVHRACYAQGGGLKPGPRAL